jgi:hypothetical protein
LIFVKEVAGSPKCSIDGEEIDNMEVGVFESIIILFEHNLQLNLLFSGQSIAFHRITGRKSGRVIIRLKI